jgi:hypothetical protein
MQHLTNVSLRDESSLQSVTYTNRTSPEGVLITQQIQRIDVPYVEDGESKVTTFNFTTEQAERDTHFMFVQCSPMPVNPKYLTLFCSAMEVGLFL